MKPCNTQKTTYFINIEFQPMHDNFNKLLRINVAAFFDVYNVTMLLCEIWHLLCYSVHVVLGHIKAE